MGKSTANARRSANGVGGGLATWHRRFGVASALLVVWLALSGILLGHSDDLDLDERHVSAAWLLDWYGIGAPAIVGYRVDGDWIMQAGERLYFNGRPLAGNYGRLAGAVALSGEIAVAAGAQLLLLTDTGELVEVLGRAHGVPAPLQAIGRRDGRLAARGPKGDYIAAADLLGWRPVRVANADWSQPSAVPQALRDRVVRDYRRRLLTVERFMLDLHSGRLLGRFGVWVMDLAAVAFLVLAGSGLWLWLLRPGRPARKRDTGRE